MNKNKEPTKNEIEALRLKQIEDELNLLDKNMDELTCGECEKTINKQSPSPPDATQDAAIAEFENKLKEIRRWESGLGYRLLFQSEIETIKQAARNLFNKAHTKGWNEGMIKDHKQSLIEKLMPEVMELIKKAEKQAQQNTASAIFEDIEKYSVMTKELKELKKKLLSEVKH